jgi:anti-sigma regulatory factor (Ser/Thr protein kinase)
MRSGAARGCLGHFHEAGFYASDEEFRDLIVPFAEEGVAAGEPVILSYDDRKSGLLRSWLKDPAAVTFIGAAALYSTPTRAIATYQGLFDKQRARGAQQIRIGGDVPHPGNGGRFEGWDRYECALNTVWGSMPVWGLCLYDRVTAPAEVIDVIERTHPRIAPGDGRHLLSARFQDSSQFRGLPPRPDPLEATPPLVELVNRSAAETRHALESLGRGRVPEDMLADLLIGVSEAVNNAVKHGRPPTTVRIWAGAARLVITVHDTGPGPADRLAGLTPAAGGGLQGGLGLWFMHQLEADVALRYAPDGFTVRLRGGGGAGSGVSR